VCPALRRAQRCRSSNNPKRKLHGLRETLGGDLQKSPLRDRLFVVVDSVHAQGLKDELVRMGLRPDNFYRLGTQ